MTNSPAAVITTSEYRILQGLKRLHTHSAEKLMEIGSQVKLECFLLPNIYKKGSDSKKNLWLHFEQSNWLDKLEKSGSESNTSWL